MQSQKLSLVHLVHRPLSSDGAPPLLLPKLPVKLDYREYPMGHEVSPQSLADVTRWLSARLDSRDAG